MEEIIYMIPLRLLSVKFSVSLLSETFKGSLSIFTIYWR